MVLLDESLWGGAQAARPKISPLTRTAFRALFRRTEIPDAERQ